MFDFKEKVTRQFNHSRYNIESVCILLQKLYNILIRAEESSSSDFDDNIVDPDSYNMYLGT